jgi:hypothetical protein
MRLVCSCILTGCVLVGLACNTSSSATPTGGSALVGDSAEALRQLGRRDADDVEKCREIAASCDADAGAGKRAVCDAIGRHCDELEAQLESDRAELEQCLEAAAACEQTAADPADCEEERAACVPADRSFRGRRGRTMECADRAEQCLDRGGGFGRRGRATEGDAGAAVCDEEATDFVGCCRGKHGDRGDAGVSGDDRFDRGRGSGFGPRRPGADAPSDDDGSDDGDRAQGGAREREND